VNRTDLGEYALVVGGVALAVVLVAVLVAAAGGGPATIDADTDANTSAPPPEYAPDAVVAEPLESTGEVTVPESLRAGAGDGKTVIIDSASRAEIEDIQPLVVALVRAGHEVRFRDQPLQQSLADADAYLRIDPGVELSPRNVEAVREFTDEGGRVLLIGEPNRIRISQSAFSASITTQRTEMTTLASEYGIVFGTRYLYDTTTNDGNFKNVLAEPTDASAAPSLDRVALYTATRVQARDGQVILRTPPSTKLSNAGPADRYPVAVRTGNVLALGDKTLLENGRHNVADNDAFISYVLAFTLSGDREPGPELPSPTPTPTATPTPTPANNSSAGA
jgi:hypothetical protein